MTVLFGHPSGNPNSYHAALAYHEAGWLEAFCVPWLPAPSTLERLDRFGLKSLSRRLARRSFAPLQDAPTIQDRRGEATRLLLRTLGRADERLAYQANDWLMQTMACECVRPAVSVVHSYEDCSLQQFEVAKRLGKACIYDLPIGYHPAWREIEKSLRLKYADWLPDSGLPEDRFVRPEQKEREISLADCVLAPSEFVARTLRSQRPEIKVHTAPYGVDTSYWGMPERNARDGPTRFLFVGQCSLRKGVPLLLEAWRKADLRNATLDLVGGWYLAGSKRRDLPAGVTWTDHVSKQDLRGFYAAADVFVLPTYFEGRALVVGEALASGLRIITTEASGCSDLLRPDYANVLHGDSEDELIACLRRFANDRSEARAGAQAARQAAAECSWDEYRRSIRTIASDYL